MPFALAALFACSQANGEQHRDEGYRTKRLAMVARQLASRDVQDARVLAAMRKVPRHLFVPERYRALAYSDRPLPIGHKQTTSQPYIVGLMTQLARVKPGDKVLEIGTGSGYQAAVLAELGVRVYSIEIVQALAKRASAVLQKLDYKVKVRHGDGYAGWTSEAPFDAVLLTAAPPRLPEPLKQQLRLGGRLVAPVGEGFQQLIVVTRTKDGFQRRDVLPVRFVPMVGEAQKR